MRMPSYMVMSTSMLGISIVPSSITGSGARSSVGGGSGTGSVVLLVVLVVGGAVVLVVLVVGGIVVLVVEVLAAVVVVGGESVVTDSAADSIADCSPPDSRAAA